MLLPHLEWFFAAYGDLNASRPVGLDMNPIPFSELRAYGEFYRVAGDDFEELKHHIQALDAAHRAHEAERSKKDE